MSEVNVRIVDDREWYCPILMRNIFEFRCERVNQERVGNVALEEALSISKEAGIDVLDTAYQCERCFNQPLKGIETDWARLISFSKGSNHI